MSAQEAVSSPVEGPAPVSAIDYPIPSAHDIRVVFSVIEHAEFKSNFKGVAEDMGFTSANNAQKKFKKLTETYGFQLVDGKVVKDGDAPATAGPGKKGAKGPRTPKSGSTGGRKRKVADENAATADDDNEGEEIEVKPTTPKKKAKVTGTGAKDNSAVGDENPPKTPPKTPTPRKKKATTAGNENDGKGTITGGGRKKKQAKSEEIVKEEALSDDDAKDVVADKAQGNVAVKKENILDKDLKKESSNHEDETDTIEDPDMLAQTAADLASEVVAEMATEEQVDYGQWVDM